jgi:predicted pyridoxine 5'-phosphate oxidase superfamily flavin-nucleotide-binding protein
LASYHDAITDAQADLIRQAPVFFVATVDPTLAGGPRGIGPINVSPKGGAPLVILDPRRVAYIDFPGSGNETARHSVSGSPITVMVCSFDPDAAIVRLYGHARFTPVAESPLAAQLLGDDYDPRAPRQIVEIEIERTMTSCGYGVPILSFVRDREAADRGKRYKER